MTVFIIALQIVIKSNNSFHLRLQYIKIKQKLLNN